ncbi:MAG: hypothetical protein H6584_04560 [Flavobacteriales bacterium]|nr:hypothetical protein [Flavobacteriales bacterium]
MKKTLIIIFVVILGLPSLKAQVSFNPTVRGGLHYSRLVNISNDGRAEYYLGIAGSLNLSKKYSFQPEITYIRQGSKNINYTFRYYNYIRGYTVEKEVNESFVADYLSLSLSNKFWFGRACFQFGPYFDLLKSDFLNRDNEVDLGLNIGSEIKITKNIRAEIRARIGTLEPYEKETDSDLYEFFAPLDNLQTYASIQMGLVYAFNVGGDKEQKETNE